MKHAAEYVIIVAKNKNIVDWMQEPKNIEHGLRLLSINGDRVPIMRPCCEVCTNMKVWKKINTLTDEEITKYTRAGKLHGLKRPLSVWENKVYHKSCLMKKIGQKKFDNLVRDGHIITE